MASSRPDRVPSDRAASPVARGAAEDGLSFAVATDAPVLERWQADVVEALHARGFAIERWLHAGAAQPSPAAHAVALELIAPEDVPASLPQPAAMRNGDQFPPVDVLLDLTRAGVEPGVRTHAGATWAFSFGREAASDPVSAAMRAIVRGPAPMPVALRAMPGGDVLRSGVIRTTSGSLSTQLDRLLLEPATWPAQVARERLVATGHLASPIPKGAAPAATPATPATEFPAIPMPLLRLGVAGREALTAAGSLVRHTEWSVGHVRRPIEGWLDDGSTPAVSWLPHRPGRYAADPFGIEVGDATHVLFEDFDQRRTRGVISAATIDAHGIWSEPEIVLDTRSHASYPYLVQTDGETWLIPETSDVAEVRLYRALELPHRWTLEARLLEQTHVSDATVVRHQGRWWMFGTSRGRGVDEALRIWHAPALTGPWQPHELDPVKIDARSARPGGTPFVRDGVLYRPAQDCSIRYGGRLAINRVEVLDERRFAEAPIRFVEPIPAFPDGLHTLSAAGSASLIDGNRTRFVAAALRAQLGARLRR
ncbi:MAG TPA: hypothetical protein VFP56_00060 [Candidatus Limnocylindrales bacterium]|nr:hypothetical protein [Candidatus Limnocylindrales bacterium]